MSSPPKTKLIILSLIALASISSVAINFFFVLSHDETPVPDRQKSAVTIYFDNQEFQSETYAKTVAELLQEQNIKPQSDDYLFPSKQTQIYPGIKIMIQKKIPLAIKVDGQTIELKTFTDTVESALEEAGVTLSHLDKVEPQKSTRTSHGLEIQVTRINIEEVTQEEPIEFQTIKKEDPALRWRHTKIKQEGENGLKQSTYRVVYQNGKQTSREKISQKISQKPKDKIVLEGTKIEVGKVSKGRASWYAHTGKLACASLEHPKGTWLRVTNRANGKSVIVQVNDSGPYSPDKIIDLDAVAFKKIGDLGQGVVNVKVEEILE
ncbi:MAG: G5 domain-containing protein [Patescibacteria group bacterium]|nr:G5 domain-containing protein [Patescibacteria group bacterium]